MFRTCFYSTKEKLLTCFQVTAVFFYYIFNYINFGIKFLWNLKHNQSCCLKFCRHRDPYKTHFQSLALALLQCEPILTLHPCSSLFSHPSDSAQSSGTAMFVRSSSCAGMKSSNVNKEPQSPSFLQSETPLFPSIRSLCLSEFQENLRFFSSDYYKPCRHHAKPKSNSRDLHMSRDGLNLGLQRAAGPPHKLDG